MLESLSKNFDKFGGFLRKNKATIYTITGMVGVGITTYQTVKSTMEVEKIIKDNKPTSKKETAKLIWKPVLKTAAPFITTEFAIFMSNRSNKKTIMALQAATIMLNTDRKAVREKILEKMGKTKGKDTISEIAKDQAKKSDSREVYQTGHGDLLCYDVFSGRYFRSSQMHIERIILDFDKTLVDGGEVCINDIFIGIGLPPITVGDLFVWGGPGQEVDYINSPTLITYNTDEKFGENCLYLDLMPDLYYDADRYFCTRS